MIIKYNLELIARVKKLLARIGIRMFAGWMHVHRKVACIQSVNRFNVYIL